MSKKCYILIQKQFMNVAIIGVYSKKEIADEIARRSNELMKESFSLWNFEVLESPLDTLNFVDEAGEFLKSKFKDIMEEYE